MNKEFWLDVPRQKPFTVQHGDQTFHVRKVSPYELSLASAQCVAYCGIELDDFKGAQPVQQIKAVAFFTAFALCDAGGVPFFDSGPSERGATSDFLGSVEQIALKPVEMLTAVSNAFLDNNSLDIDPEALDAAKKNLKAISSEDGNGGKP